MARKSPNPPQVTLRPYYRRDQNGGITSPDLSKTVSYAEHIVRARGKKTQYTSVSLDLAKIRDFGPAEYELIRQKCKEDGHHLVEHDELIRQLREVMNGQDRKEKARAIQAIRYASKRVEGLVDWRFEKDNQSRTDLIAFAHEAVQPFFTKV